MSSLGPLPNFAHHLMQHRREGMDSDDPQLVIRRLWQKTMPRLLYGFSQKLGCNCGNRFQRICIYIFHLFHQDPWGKVCFPIPRQRFREVELVICCTDMARDFVLQSYWKTIRSFRRAIVFADHGPPDVYRHPIDLLWKSLNVGIVFGGDI